MLLTCGWPIAALALALSDSVPPQNDPLGDILDQMVLEADSAQRAADDSANIAPPAAVLTEEIPRQQTSTGGAIVEQVSKNLEKVIDFLTIDGRRVSTAIFPAISYNSRSGFGFGLMPMLNINGHRLPKPASVSFSFLISTKRMFEIQCDANLELPHRLSLTAEGKLEKQPDRLYALGNGRRKEPIAEYEYHRQLLTAELVKGFGRKARLIGGINLDADHYTFSALEPFGTDSLQALRLFAGGGGWNGGAGAVIGYDSRDRVLAPHRGAHVRLIAMGYFAGHRYGLLTFDARRYWPLPLKSTFAAQLYIQHSWGDTPFAKLPTCGGSHLGRAIGHYLKYLDRSAWLAQIEWRVPLVWRLGLAAFAAAANVCHDRTSIFGDIHAMGGGGLRLVIFEKAGLSARLDFGASNHGDRSFFFGLREAF